MTAEEGMGCMPMTSREGGGRLNSKQMEEFLLFAFQGFFLTSGVEGAGWRICFKRNRELEEH